MKVVKHIEGETPQAVGDRIRAAICHDSPIDCDSHVQAILDVVLRARRAALNRVIEGAAHRVDLVHSFLEARAGRSRP